MNENPAKSQIKEIETGYTIDDLLKLLCRITARMMAEDNKQFADITETVHGEGITFKYQGIPQGSDGMFST